MSKRIYEIIKAATVAVALFHPDRPAQRNRPFTIVGSGFCIHTEGIVITCEHVFKAFVDPAVYKKVVEESRTNSSSITVHELKSAIPHVLFYAQNPQFPTQLRVFPVPIENAVSKTDFDLAALKLQKHKAFPNSYPTIPIADYSELHEMMEIGTCGFPLGDVLGEQVGTMTSSFTKGMISSIIPAPNTLIEHLEGFQLDLTATNGNSGRPVFSLSTGKVFGVLKSGVVHPDNNLPVQGLTVAEPIYPILENDLIERLLKGITLPTGSERSPTDVSPSSPIQ